MKRRYILFVLFASSLAFLGLLYWGIGPTPSCLFPSTGPLHPGHSTHLLESADGRRCYLLTLPTSFDPDRPIPLILSLHGFSSNPHGQRAFSQWDPLAEQVYAAVVYPQGTGFPQRWNADPEFFEGGVDDVAFIQSLIEQLSTQLPVAQEQIYITGFSNGGAMTLRLACALSDQIAAIGTVAAPVTPSLADCQPDRPVPLIAFHGTQDPIVPFLGRAAGDDEIPIGGAHMPTLILQPALTWVEQWAQGYDCNQRNSWVDANGEIEGLIYSDCAQGAEVKFVSVKGGGHTWPGGRPIPFVGKTTQAIKASDEMWSFFSQQQQ